MITVLVSGPAKSCKSALIMALSNRARELGCAVEFSPCLGGGPTDYVGAIARVMPIVYFDEHATKKGVIE